MSPGRANGLYVVSSYYVVVVGEGVCRPFLFGGAQSTAVYIPLHSEALCTVLPPFSPHDHCGLRGTALRSGAGLLMDLLGALRARCCVRWRAL